MGQCFKQLTLEDRCEIARRSEAGESARQIAAALDRSPSSITRELKRNAQSRCYKPAYAQEQARARRWKGSRLVRQPELQKRVLRGLEQGHSPEIVSGTLALAGVHISYESIYRFIYAQIARTKNYDWRRYLPRGKAKRGFRGRKGGSPAEHIQERVSLEKRTSKADNRVQPGHWESDLILFARYGQILLALHERTTRLTVILRQPSKAAEGVAQTLETLLAPLPPRLRRTLTFDNGTEFAQHHRLKRHLGIKTFFCDPHAPWQKGGIENAIGRIRRYLPRKTNLDDLTPKQIRQFALAYNHTPRKCLGFLTPAQAFAKVLHFECESTFPLARE